MNGLIAKNWAGAAAVAALSAVGCTETGKFIDPCYPERYIAQSRAATIAAFAPQVQNGHVLDQTMWNYLFDPGKSTLTAGGRDQLDAIVRARPHPDPRIFLATARDIVYDPADPEAYVMKRQELDSARVAEIQKYLAVQTAGRPMGFEVVVHDPREVYQHADPMNRAIRLSQSATTGSFTTGTQSTTASSTGGQR